MGDLGQRQDQPDLENPAAAPVAERQQVKRSAPLAPSNVHQPRDAPPAGSDIGESSLLRRIRREALAAKPAAGHDPWLYARLREKPSVGETYGHIRSEAQFREVEERYHNFARHRPLGLAPAQDPTIPTTDEDKV